MVTALDHTVLVHPAALSDARVLPSPRRHMLWGVANHVGLVLMGGALMWGQLLRSDLRHSQALYGPIYLTDLGLSCAVAFGNSQRTPSTSVPGT